jgi:hypothetical protein
MPALRSHPPDLFERRNFQMSKSNTPPTSNPAVDPFRGRPFNRFPAGSPLYGNADRFAPRVNVTPVEEQTRAAGIPAHIAGGRAAPRYGDAAMRRLVPRSLPLVIAPLNRAYLRTQSWPHGFSSIGLLGAAI